MNTSTHIVTGWVFNVVLVLFQSNDDEGVPRVRGRIMYVLVAGVISADLLSGAALPEQGNQIASPKPLG